MPGTDAGLLGSMKNFFFPKKESPAGELSKKTESSAIALPGYPLMTWSGDEVYKQLHPYYGVVSGVYYAMTGMPWLSSDARKAVKTEWFWQPIRGQPRRVDTNELRKYANTVWVQSIVMHILKQIGNIPWDIVPQEEEVPYESVKDEVARAKEFFHHPNKNRESWEDIVQAWLKDVLEIDAGVLVKTFTIDSYDFEHLEPRSGAPLLKPLICPECMGKRKILPGTAQQKAMRVLTEIERVSKSLPDFRESEMLKEEDGSKMKYALIKPDYQPVIEKMIQVVSANSSFDENVIDVDCPFCNGTGQGRHLTEIYAQDGAAFLKDVDRTGWIYGYWQYSYAIPAHPMWFCPEEIIYFMATPRSQGVYGYSALQSSLEIVKSLEYSVRHNMSLFLDGAVPDGVVGVEDMSTEELKRMKTAWENELKGQPHKVVFVNKKTTFSPFAFNNREMQFRESQVEAWKQVMANFMVSPVEFGILEDTNRATAGTEAELSRRKAVRPLLTKIEALINEHVMPELGCFNTRFAYVIDDPVEKRMQAELDKLYLDANLKSVNEIRIEMGLPPVEWGEKPASQMFNPLVQNTRKPGEAQGIQDTQDSVQDGPKDAAQKGYQYPFQSQVPFLTTVQNLSTPVPFALPKHGHPNTQYPYNAMNGLCPGCGYQTLISVGEAPGGISVGRWFQCQRCHRSFTEDELRTGQQEQERMHETGEKTDEFVKPQRIDTELNDVLAPRALRGIQQTPMMSMAPVAPIPNLVPTTGEVPVMDMSSGKLRARKDADTDLKKKAELMSPIIDSKFLDNWLGFQAAPLWAFIRLFLARHNFVQVDVSQKKKKKLKEVFEQAFFEGLNLDQLAEAIVNIGIEPERAEAIARTETIRIANEAKLLQAESKGYEKVQFVATKDKWTCDTCSKLDGKIMGIEEAKGLIPGRTHPNCRCTINAVVL